MKETLAEYQSTPPTLNEGENTLLQSDVRGNLKSTIMTKPADPADNPVTAYSVRALMSVQLTAGANKIISSSPAVLVGIIIGSDTASGVIEVSDSATDGDGNVKIELNGSTLMTSTSGYVPVNAYFEVGIAVDQTNQLDCTYVSYPA